MNISFAELEEMSVKHNKHNKPPRWLSGLDHSIGHSACWPDGIRALAGLGLNPDLEGRVFQLDWTSGHDMRLNSWTGIEGPPVSSVNCDRPLYSGLKALELVMDAGCRDHRWTASLCTWPPGCSPLVLLPS